MTPGTLLAILLEPFAMIVIMVFAYGLAGRSIQGTMVRKFVIGAIFSAAVIYALTHPIEMTEGIITDLRNLFVGFAMAMFGPIAGLMALATGVAARVYIGGAGMSSGIFALCLAALGGLAWRTFVLPRPMREWHKTLLMGVAISAHLFAVVMLPTAFLVPFLTTFAPILLVSNLVGCFLLRSLIVRERSLIVETEELAHAAATDPLTKALNRRSVEPAMGKLPDSFPPGFGRAVIVYDVDNFKSFNDAHGHAMGDLILTELTATVRSNLRDGDLFVRLGGDEFAVVLPNVTKQDAAQIAERCRANVAAHSFGHADEPLAVTISLGVRWTDRPADFVQQLAESDQALYHAKAAGRNLMAILTGPHTGSEADFAIPGLAA